MRRLLLLRHAKAEAATRGDDFDRALTDSGRADAARIAAWMVEANLIPDSCLYSGAARTLETHQILARELQRPFAAERQNALYEASRFLIMGLLREQPAEARALLIVGHNPGMADVANLLAGEGPPVMRLRMASKFPTAALAVIAFDRPHWSDLSANAGRLEHFVTPSDL